MELDYSRLLPALFDDRDMVAEATIRQVFSDIICSDFVSNSSETTFLGFVEDSEVRIRTIVNRLSVEFINGEPSKGLIDDIVKLFKEDETNFISNVWVENNTIIVQYYWNPNV